MPNPIKVNRKPYQWLKDTKKRRNHLWGSASSSKSHTIAQFLCFDLFVVLANIGILIVRKTRPAVKTSCWELVTGYLDKANIPYKANLTELKITGPNKSFILFDGLDNIGKKKSIEGINYIWIEEFAGLSTDTRITEREFRLLNTICRAPANPNRMNQIFTSFNPCDKIGNKFIEEITVRGDTPNTGILHINFEENPFLSEADYQNIIDNAEEDASYDKVYRRGEWALLVGQIYERWDIVDKMPEEYEKRIWGLDFGFVNPAALIEIRIIGKETWEQEHIYLPGLTNPQLAAKIEPIVKNHEPIIADSAEPKSIQELVNAGLNIFPAAKGPDSVSHSIRSVQHFKTHLLNTSTNLIDEKAGYKWATDKNDEIKQPPKPFKEKDHLMDSERYAIDSIVTKVKATMVMTDLEDDEDPDEAMWTTQE